ncbi:hypothetical protein Goklo_005127 [Gossypium klotzschianum]|uniref:Uncharacterized protein n=1 Tax=Gossypium klotzschianum TaxID=34286 RepID=A0A7J8VS50_9ROSI|nr:hypothetical protein [Gossypium klotzschianum]
MSNSSQKSTVHSLQTAEDQQQTTEEDHQHLVPKKIDVPKIHEPQVSISAKNKIDPSKPPPPAAAPLVAHPEPGSPQDEKPLPTMVESSIKPIPSQDYSPSSPASQAGVYPYSHFNKDESPGSSFTQNRSRVQSPLGSPVMEYPARYHRQGLPLVPATVSPNASNLPEDYKQPKKVLSSKRSESPSSRPCCGCGCINL